MSLSMFLVSNLGLAALPTHKTSPKRPRYAKSVEEIISKNNGVFSLGPLAQKMKPLMPPRFLKAHDGVKLAIYPYMPKQSPKQVLVFYHGGGSYSGSGYQVMADELAREFNIGTILVDVRGHGNSRGPRGDAPSVAAVYKDIDLVIHYARTQFPKAHVFLGGHSSGAGLLVNHSTYHRTEGIQGYVFLAPNFGYHSGTLIQPKDPRRSFVVKVDSYKFIFHEISGGRWYAHSPAVYFNYSEKVLAKSPFLVPFYTVTMANAVTPQSPTKQIKDLKLPFSILIGNQDEVLKPDAVIQFQTLADPKKQRSMARIVEGETHLSILLGSLKWIAQDLNRFSE